MKLTKFFFMIFTVVASTAFVGCSNDDDDTMVQVRVNGVVFDNGDDFNGDVDGDFTGNGGSATRTFVWLNNLTTADYNADITATTDGTFNIVVLDADGTTVLNRSLDGAVEPDSFSGVTDAGTSGVWSVTITVNSFNGDGSFSLSEGN
ncbi:hypothetical protein DKG77_09020 [Flagellimonas aquimarina]|uniref:Uncharacterized protein n=1 Tax=Flagellimonas aquimarina TaxID=2201895 RepID=A0A316LE89_9FLAO|nr:hypothetical protein [Allomuricauda koreensis]PWL38400.1 hypothetical protein DKG77_09020 [Allomuricauda koreensis]